MKRVKITNKYITIIMVFSILFPVTVMGAGMENPNDIMTNFANNTDSHQYYYPSSFERMDTLSGRYNIIIPYVSLPGDGALSLTVLGVNDYMHSQEVYGVWKTETIMGTNFTMSPDGSLIDPVMNIATPYLWYKDLDEYATAQNTPFGIGWNVFHEVVKVSNVEVRSDEDGTEEKVLFQSMASSSSGTRQNPFPTALIKTQDGINHQAFPCNGEDCNIDIEQWDEGDNVSCFLNPNLGNCKRQTEVFVTNDNWTVVAHMESHSGNLFKHIASTVHMPNGIT